MSVASSAIFDEVLPCRGEEAEGAALFRPTGVVLAWFAHVGAGVDGFRAGP